MMNALKPEIMKVHYDTLGELLSDLSEAFSVEIPLITGGIQYEGSMRLTLDISHPKKMLHVQIYRLQSGRYEYNGYIL